MVHFCKKFKRRQLVEKMINQKKNRGHSTSKIVKSRQSYGNGHLHYHCSFYYLGLVHTLTGISISINISIRKVCVNWGYIRTSISIRNGTFSIFLCFCLCCESLSVNRAYISISVSTRVFLSAEYTKK